MIHFSRKRFMGTSCSNDAKKKKTFLFARGINSFFLKIVHIQAQILPIMQMQEKKEKAVSGKIFCWCKGETKENVRLRQFPFFPGLARTRKEPWLYYWLHDKNPPCVLGLSCVKEREELAERERKREEREEKEFEWVRLLGWKLWGGREILRPSDGGIIGRESA